MTAFGAELIRIQENCIIVQVLTVKNAKTLFLSDVTMRSSVNKSQHCRCDAASTRVDIVLLLPGRWYSPTRLHGIISQRVIFSIFRYSLKSHIDWGVTWRTWKVYLDAPKIQNVTGNGRGQHVKVEVKRASRVHVQNQRRMHLTCGWSKAFCLIETQGFLSGYTGQL